MSNWLSRIFSIGAGELTGKIGEAINKVQDGHLSKREAELEVEQIIAAANVATQAAVSSEIASKERIMVAEMAQDDRYTKRARPTIVYFGLGLFAIDMLARYVSHFGGDVVPPSMVPQEFWMAWGGVTGIYSFTRSKYDKQGVETSPVLGIPQPGRSILSD